MQKELKHFIHELQNGWKFKNIEAFYKIQSLVKEMALNETIRNSLKGNSNSLFSGIELYRDEKEGFILLAYAEKKGTYRDPHNHGNGWVVYAVIEGEIEMGNFININSRLIIKDDEILKAGECRLYFPGDIHETRCLSETVIILRLTSCDLKEEDRLGRMKRFKQ